MRHVIVVTCHGSIDKQAHLMNTETVAALWDATAKPGAAEQRDEIVGVYQAAKFRKYKILDDGYPLTTDVDYKMLIDYGANADRHESWLSNVTPTRDTQQPFATQGPIREN